MVDVVTGPTPIVSVIHQAKREKCPLMTVSDLEERLQAVFIQSDYSPATRKGGVQLFQRERPAPR